MVSDPPTSEASTTTAANDTSPPPETAALKTTAAAWNINQTSNEATIESNTLGGAESTCNNNDNGESSSSVLAVKDYGDDREKSLEFSDELMERGSVAVREGDFELATDCFSQALEIRVAHYDELSPECVDLYYKYGCALLSKAQEEADPLGVVPKKDAESQQDSDKDGSVKNGVNVESSVTSVTSNAQQDEGSNQQEGTADEVSNGKAHEEDEEESDVDDLTEAEVDEDESDLDLAWKMLDVARAIVEKHSDDTMKKVDILSSLAEVSLEREDVETSLSDYLKALSILERLVEPDSRYIAELNFRICLCLEIGSKAEEAIPYCQKAISICKSRVERLKKEVKEATATSTVRELDQVENQSSIVSQSDDTISDTDAEIATLANLSGELEKKLEDLQHLVLNPTSILSELLGLVAAKAKGNGGDKSASTSVLRSSQMGAANSIGDLDSPTVSTAHTNGAAASGSGGVTHLGVVGRGVKRVVMNAETAESNPSKKPALDKAEGSAS